MARIRVRQHVNPLAQKYQQPVSLPDWQLVYADLTQPLHLDIGCGRGRFLLHMATLQPEWNFLGLEIREPLVMEALEKRDQLGLKNLHYVFCHANNSLRSLVESFPVGKLQRATIQFPDPWFKNRHQKRRMVQPELVDILALYLVEGGIVFIQSDVETLAVDMCSQVETHPAFKRQGDSWLAENPFPVASEREKSTLERSEPVYRALFEKRKTQEKNETL